MSYLHSNSVFQEYKKPWSGKDVEREIVPKEDVELNAFKDLSPFQRTNREATPEIEGSKGNESLGFSGGSLTSSCGNLSRISAENDGRKDGLRVISFWEAITLLREDKEFWTPYIPSHEKAKKKGFFNFFKKQKTNWKVSPKEDPCIAEDLNFFLALTKIPFSYDNIVLRRILHSIYASLVIPYSLDPWWKRKLKREKSRKPCLLVATKEGEGSLLKPFHPSWKKIGFQGDDPTTDLRSTGILGLLHLLYLIDLYPSLNYVFWMLCHSSTETEILEDELPYALVGFNFTAIGVEVLLKGYLRHEVKSMRKGRNIVDSFAEGSRHGDSSGPQKAVSYSNLNDDERALLTTFPVLVTTSEFFTGCIAEFVQMWVATAKKMSPQKVTVANFNEVRYMLSNRWTRKKKQPGVFFSAAESRFLAMPDAKSAEEVKERGNKI